MSDIAIKVRGLGKKYYIGEKLPQRSLAGSIKNAAGLPWKVAKSLISGKAIDQREEFWALKDVAFDVKQGEVLGIIGRNGAGKSTLLKILSRITTPTEGEVELFGRVGCLLEVGTGFHPELTGRENIFLNGSLLGMSNVEIKQRFDEIVDFSGVERFLETPVKFYSSGMYTRLAFSVAAHLNPEILIVDEVLAVGDAEFQKKCLGKMDSIAKSGRTILFVSHNMAAIEQLCTSAILLNNGARAKSNTDVASVVKEYVFANELSKLSCGWENPGTDNFDNDYFKPLKFYFSDADGHEIRNMPIRNDQDIWINITGETRKLDPALYFGIGILTETDTFLFGSMFFDGHPDVWPKIKTGTNLLRCQFPKHLLNEGIYKIEIHGGLLNKEFYFLPGHDNPKIFLEIKGGLSKSPLWTEKRLGLFAPVIEWKNINSIQ